LQANGWWPTLGDHKRTVLAGLKRDRTNPREIEGEQALFVVNLAPRKMAGMVSEGNCSDSTEPRELYFKSVFLYLA